MSLRLAIWLYFGLMVLDIKSLNTNKSRWSLSSLISESFTSSEVLLNVSACIFCDIPTSLWRLELHRQLTHQPDCDRIFWKLLSSTFSFAVTVVLSSDLQMPVMANFCVSSTTYLSRLTSTIYKRRTLRTARRLQNTNVWQSYVRGNSHASNASLFLSIRGSYLDSL